MRGEHQHLRSSESKVTPLFGGRMIRLHSNRHVGQTIYGVVSDHVSVELPVLIHFSVAARNTWAGGLALIESASVAAMPHLPIVEKSTDLTNSYCDADKGCKRSLVIS